MGEPLYIRPLSSLHYFHNAKKLGAMPIYETISAFFDISIIFFSHIILLKMQTYPSFFSESAPYLAVAATWIQWMNKTKYTHSTNL